MVTGSYGASSFTSSPLHGKLFVVIGAGGAGKALAYGAKEKGARVVIANRTFGKLLNLVISVKASKCSKGMILPFRHFYERIKVVADVSNLPY